MLTLYRRHLAKCKNQSRRAKCSCPIWAQGVLRGEKIRESLGLTSWEAANRLINDWEAYGKNESLTVREACEKFLADCETRNLSKAIRTKYEYVKDELIEKFGDRPVRGVSADDL